MPRNSNKRRTNNKRRTSNKRRTNNKRVNSRRLSNKRNTKRKRITRKRNRQSGGMEMGTFQRVNSTDLPLAHEFYRTQAGKDFLAARHAAKSSGLSLPQAAIRPYSPPTGIETTNFNIVYPKGTKGPKGTQQIKINPQIKLFPQLSLEGKKGKK